MGGKEIGVDRLRARAIDGSSELTLEFLGAFQSGDPLNKEIMPMASIGDKYNKIFTHSRWGCLGYRVHK